MLKMHDCKWNTITIQYSSYMLLWTSNPYKIQNAKCKRKEKKRKSDNYHETHQDINLDLNTLQQLNNYCGPFFIYDQVMTGYCMA